jgi:hypothetical protein
MILSDSRILEEMEKGWDHPPIYKYRPMQGITQAEAV